MLLASVSSAARRQNFCRPSAGRPFPFVAVELPLHPLPAWPLPPWASSAAETPADAHPLAAPLAASAWPGRPTTGHCQAAAPASPRGAPVAAPAAAWVPLATLMHINRGVPPSREGGQRLQAWASMPTGSAGLECYGRSVLPTLGGLPRGQPGPRWKAWWRGEPAPSWGKEQRQHRGHAPLLSQISRVLPRRRGYSRPLPGGSQRRASPWGHH